MKTPAATRVGDARRRLDARLVKRKAALHAKGKDVEAALRVIRDAARRGDPKALAVIGLCLAPFT